MKQGIPTPEQEARIEEVQMGIMDLQAELKKLIVETCPYDVGDKVSITLKESSPEFIGEGLHFSRTYSGTIDRVFSDTYGWNLFVNDEKLGPVVFVQSDFEAVYDIQVTS